MAGRRAVLHALAAARTAAARAGERVDEAGARLTEALAESAFPTAAAVRAAALSAGDRDALRALEESHAHRRSAAESQLADPDVAAAPADPADVPAAEASRSDALGRRIAAADALAHARRRHADGSVLLDGLRDSDTATAERRAELAVVGPLADVVRGEGANERRMRLESYVLAARLEQIVDAANVRLSVMTDGRFTLQHDASIGYRNVRSGLGLAVLDEHTGRPRPTTTLSGGETFLASLALALGLAEVVSAEAGGVRLDTLFVDEGFGSLDRETLDTAMRTLDSLRAGGRVVGLISHVEAMQEDIPAGLHVERQPDGSSRVRLRTPVLA